MKDINEYVKKKTSTFMFYFINAYLNATDVEKEELATIFICQIIEECKPKVSKQWIATLLDVCDDVNNGEMRVEEVFEILKDAGVAVSHK